MKLHYYLLAIFAVIASLSACNGDLKEKQATLDARENALNEREKNFTQKEADYRVLLKMRDSIKLVKDTTKIVKFPENLLGKWSIKMICTEAGCSEHAIGDVRNDDFEFYYDNHQLFGKVSNRSGFQRIYSGNYDGKEINLKFNSDPAATKPLDVIIHLNQISDTRITGIRELTGENNCVSKFSVELLRTKN